MSFFKNLFKEVWLRSFLQVMDLRLYPNEPARKRCCFATSNTIEYRKALMSMANEMLSQSAKKDVITLFHKPSNQASMRAHTLLKQTAANATSTATEDQATDHASQSKLERTEFELGM